MVSSSSVDKLIQGNQFDRPIYMAIQNRENDKSGALSSVPDGVLMTEDVTTFLNAKQEELGETFIQSKYLSLCTKGKLQDKYAKLVSSGLINGVCYPAVF